MPDEQPRQEGSLVEVVTKDEFLAYEGVRVSGVTNMYAVRTVCDLSGLEREQVLHVMKHYGELYERHIGPLSERGRA